MFKKKMVDLGYPFGGVEVPEGWILVQLDACCSASKLCYHPQCDPLWGKRVISGGGMVVASPAPVPHIGWRAVVAFPPEGVEDEFVKAVQASRSLPTTDWEDYTLEEAAFAALHDALEAAKSGGLEGIKEKIRWASHYLQLMEAIFKIASSWGGEGLAEFLEAVNDIYVTDHNTGVRG